MQSEYGLTELAHLGKDAGLLLPLEVDDHLITEDEVLPQPAEDLSLVAGLNGNQQNVDGLCYNRSTSTATLPLQRSRNRFW
jgi:hypothetical protein